MMMKKWCLMILIICSVQIVHAQTFAEWFAQKKTQIKYLGIQIAALQVYAGYLQKGYHIAQHGLTAISDIKNGEFNLHKDYFGSLSNVSPAIAKDARIAAIIAMQLTIVQQYHKAYSNAKSSGQFNNSEVNYIYTVFANLLNQCADDLTELVNITTSGKYQLSDEERIKRLDDLYSDMQDKYAFAQSFSNQTGVMALSRKKDANDAAILQQMYDIK
ncbi:hypothetical protein [Parafilimonas sp.]|uniref:hypothetical protein n=1 Tax=Parafilimonas sp. TaxID=1969739 RepID=UPI003F7FF7FB